MTKVFMVGGPGNISRGTVDYLLKRNYELGIYTRNIEEKKENNPEVKFYEGDRANRNRLEKAFIDFGADLVIDTICFEPSEAKALYQITEGKIKQVIFISTVDTYGYPLSRLPFREKDEFRPPHGSYAQKKRTIELFYRDKFHKEGYPVTIGRPSLSIGPGFCPMMYVDWGIKVVPRMKANQPILVPGAGRGLMHVGWAYDVGRMVGRIIGDSGAVGEDYTLSYKDCITREQYISLFTDYLGVDPEIIYVPQQYINSFPGIENIDTIDHLYNKNMAFSLEKFKKHFSDYKWLPLERGVKEFIDINESEGVFSEMQLEEEIIDDRIIKKWQSSLRDWNN